MFGDDGKSFEQEKAEFCLATGVQPSEYDNLTDDEREAFIAIVNKRSSS